jgi:hypothetical protein
MRLFRQAQMRPDRWQRVMGEDHPPHRNAAEQPQ